ncbi:MAG: bacteriocin immunity protein [Pantoea sp.]|uniref:bacteriocin immunity protein n=1 Tax=Pantoea sp. TaxID=69393 RepID=UPI00238CEDC0|nr:bacteriocin immunity protein [Pantoea sp.]MDE1186592.1 bacteriocin immunity protein [Pantoea sp.]
MERKGKLQDYTEIEFTNLIEEIFSADGGEEYQDSLIDHICEISGYPDCNDLIFWSDDDLTPQDIVNEIKTWRTANNKPGFKS